MWYLCVVRSMWIRNAAEIVTARDLAVTCCDSSDNQVKQHVFRHLAGSWNWEFRPSLALEETDLDHGLAIRSKRFGRISRTQRGDVLKFRFHHLERRRSGIPAEFHRTGEEQSGYVGPGWHLGRNLQGHLQRTWPWLPTWHIEKCVRGVGVLDVTRGTVQTRPFLAALLQSATFLQISMFVWTDDILEELRWPKTLPRWDIDVVWDGVQRVGRSEKAVFNVFQLFSFRLLNFYNLAVSRFGSLVKLWWICL